MRSTRKRLVANLDRVFSKYIRARDRRCVTCETEQNLQCGHLFSRNTYSTRWNENNAFAQCAACNISHEHDAYPLTNYFLCAYGKAAYDELHITYKTRIKYSNSMLEEMIRYYETKLVRENRKRDEEDQVTVIVEEEKG